MKIALRLMTLLLLAVVYACTTRPEGVDTNRAALAQQAPKESFDSKIEDNAKDLLEEGKKYYRTTPLKGLFVRAKGGFYHDGRFADYQAVVSHYDRTLELSLPRKETADLVEYLKSR